MPTNDDADLLNQHNLFGTKPLPPKESLRIRPHEQLIDNDPVAEAKGFVSVAGAKRSQEERNDAADEEWVGYSPNTVDRMKRDRAPAETVAKEAATGYDAHGNRVKTSFWADKSKEDPTVATKHQEQRALFATVGPQTMRREASAFGVAEKKLDDHVREFRAGNLTDMEFKHRTSNIDFKPSRLLRTDSASGASTEVDGFTATYDVDGMRFRRTGQTRADAVSDMVFHLKQGEAGAAEVVPARQRTSTTSIANDAYTLAVRYFTKENERYMTFANKGMGYRLDVERLRRHAASLGMTLPDDLAAIPTRAIFAQSKLLTNPANRLLEDELNAHVGQGDARERTDAMVRAREVAQNERYGEGREAYRSSAHRATDSAGLNEALPTEPNAALALVNAQLQDTTTPVTPTTAATPPATLRATTPR